MKFEEVLPLMRQGKKAKHAKMMDGEYWICGTAEFKLDANVPKWPTLVRIFDNPFEDGKNYDTNSHSWGIQRWAIMEDTWEIVEEED